MAHQNNAIDYVEFPGRDLPKVKDFYSAAFGWAFQDYGPTYVAFSQSGIEGGFQADDAETPAKPLVILYADNLEAAEEAVRKAGGKIVKPIFSFPGGRRFHFADPAGNELAVWTEAK